MARSAAIVHNELARRVNSLGSIASTAAWLGFLGGIVGIASSLRGTIGERHAVALFILRELSVSLLPIATGLAVALLAAWCYRYLQSELAALDSEMNGTARRLLHDLVSHQGFRSTGI